MAVFHSKVPSGLLENSHRLVESKTKAVSVGFHKKKMCDF